MRAAITAALLSNQATMNILPLLDELKEMIDKPKTFMGMTFGLPRDEIHMQILKVRASLPNDLKAAAATVRESDRIVESAKEDATMTLESARKEAARIIEESKAEGQRILEHARVQQERMVADSEVLKLSKAQSEEIRNAADRDAAEMRRGADRYAVEVLSRLEGVTAKVMAAIEQGKQAVERPDVAVVQPRERARV